MNFPEPRFSDFEHEYDERGLLLSICTVFNKKHSL